MRTTRGGGALACALARAVVPVIVLGFMVAGCGVSGTGGLYGGAGGGSTTAGGSGSGAGLAGAGIVSTATASVAGQSETILTDPQGHSVYYFAEDTSTKSACTTGCNGLWPPLIVSSGAPTSAASLPGTLSALDVGNGMQVLYNGHPLYRYSGDSAAGQTNGEGIEGKWHVATPNVAANAAPAPGAQPTDTPCSGYYCY